MLNHTAYWVQPSFASQPGIDTYAILDPGTGIHLGLAWEQQPGPLRRLVRSAFGRNLLRTSLHVGENVADGQRLVFTLRELPSLWRPRLALMDADGHLLCRFIGVFATIAGGFKVHDPGGKLLGRLVCESLDGRYVVHGRTGLHIGTIDEQSPPPLGIDAMGPGGYLIQVAETAESGRVGSLLLLAAALALDLVYRDRVGADPKPVTQHARADGSRKAMAESS